MKQVLCLSTTPWHEHFTRKQQVMSRLTDCEILYINPPVTQIARFKDKKAVEYLKLNRQPPYKPMPNVTVYTPPAVMPFYNKKRGINRYNQKHIMLPFVTAAMKQQGFKNPLMWVYSPSYADLAPLLSKSGLVYDCVDRHSAYKGLIDPQVVDKMEEDLCRQCSTVFATAQGLFETLSQYNKNTFLLPNGANYELFSQAMNQDLQCPPELKAMKKPIYGFVGALQEWIDYNCIIEVAKRGGGSVVCVGPTGAGVDISALSQLPDVHILGARPQTELPKYIAQFDVCLNPFRAGRLAKDVSPLKFYEYLATGKPVVSTRQPLQVNDFADVVSIADEPREFALMAIAAAKGRDEAVKNKQLEHAKACSWDSRVGQMRSVLGDLLK